MKRWEWFAIILLALLIVINAFEVPIIRDGYVNIKSILQLGCGVPIIAFLLFFHLLLARRGEKKESA